METSIPRRSPRAVITIIGSYGNMYAGANLVVDSRRRASHYQFVIPLSTRTRQERMFLSARAEVEDALASALSALDLPTDDLGIEEPPADVDAVLASSVAYR